MPEGKLTEAHQTITRLTEERDKHLQRKIETGLSLGRILGREYDGFSVEELVTELVQAKFDLSRLRTAQTPARP